MRRTPMHMEEVDPQVAELKHEAYALVKDTSSDLAREMRDVLARLVNVVYYRAYDDAFMDGYHAGCKDERDGAD